MGRALQREVSPAGRVALEGLAATATAEEGCPVFQAVDHGAILIDVGGLNEVTCHKVVDEVCAHFLVVLSDDLPR